MDKNLIRLAVVMAVFVASFHTVNAQWVQMDMPRGEAIRLLATTNGNIFAMSIASNRKINCFYLSTNNGASWIEIDSNMVKRSICSIAASGGNFFAGTSNSGVYLSTNNGISWTKVNTGLFAPKTAMLYVPCLTAVGSNVFAGARDGVFLSTNNGTSWTSVLHLVQPYSLVVSGSNIFAGTSGSGVYLSMDSGTTWTAVNSGLPSNTFGNISVPCLAASGNNILAWIDTFGVYLSMDSGTSWTAVNSGIGTGYVSSLNAYGSNVFACISGDCYRSTDNGTTWTTFNFDLGITSIVMIDSNIFAGTTSGIFLSTNNGTSWASVDYVSLPPHADVYSLAVSDGNIFAGSNLGVFRSSDSGTTWTAVNSGLNGAPVNSFALTGSSILAGTDFEGVCLSTNNGTNWAKIDSSPDDVLSFAVTGSTIFAATEYNGVFLSTNNGTDWAAIDSSPDYVRSFAVSDSNIFAGIAEEYSPTRGAVLLSTDSGKIWARVDSGFKNVKSLVIIGNNIFAGTDSGVFFSRNNGATWTTFSGGLSANISVSSIAVMGNNIFAGTNAGVWRRPISETTGAMNPEKRRGQLEQVHLQMSYSGNNDRSVIVKLFLPYSNHVCIKVFNLRGQEIASLVNKTLAQGTHHLTWNTRNAAPGCYTLLMKAETHSCIKRIPIFR